MKRQNLVAIGILLLGSPDAIASEPPSVPRLGPKAERPPRKVVIGTAIFGPYGEYPGLETRLRELGALIDEMAERAGRQYPGEGLDLAVLPETTISPNRGQAIERALPLKGAVQDAFGTLARKHKTYILAPLDLKETLGGKEVATNAAVLFDRKGEVAGIYRKAHPVALVNSDSLEGGITPGRDFPVFECDFGRLGVQICWDIQFPDGWDILARGGAEIVAWPTASPATVLPSARAAIHRYYVVSSAWRDNSTIYEPTGMVAARVTPPGRVLVHQVDLSYAIMGWSGFLRDGAILREKFGDRVGYHYSNREDTGLFWSNDPKTTIAEMVRAVGGEELDSQVERNRRLQRGAGYSQAGAGIRVRVRKDGDRADVSMSPGAGCVVTMHSATGIGGAALEPAGGGWPGRLTVRLALRGLESLRISCGEITLAASVPSSPGSPPRLVRIDGQGREQPLDEHSALRLDLRAVDAAGHPAVASGPPAAFEFPMPGELLKKSGEPIRLEWVDFYR